MARLNFLSLAAASIRSRPLHAALCVIAGAAGIALLCALFLISGAVADGLSRNARGIDVIAGAKGSAPQLVLSAIYHADVPTGNIEMADFEKIRKNRQVRSAIPLALGDNYKGSRIVGTTPEYLSLYQASFAEGRAFAAPFEAVAGAATERKIGEKFAAIHGFADGGDDVHDWHLYEIVGVLKPTGTVLDRLITTPVESVQQLHSHPHDDDPDAAEEVKLGHQITAVLIKTKSPLGVMNLPRELNRESNVMATSPAYQMARLAKTLGMGQDLLSAIGVGIVVLSMMMMLSMLASGLAARRYDLAVLRVLGARPSMLFSTVLAEGVILGLTGAVVGLVAGHGIAYLVAVMVPSLEGLVLPSALLAPTMLDAYLLGAGLAAGLVGGMVPAVSAARTDIATLLAKGRS